MIFHIQIFGRLLCVIIWKYFQRLGLEEKGRSFNGVWNNNTVASIAGHCCCDKSKRTTEALLIGCVSSYLIIAAANKSNPVTLMVDSFFK